MLLLPRKNFLPFTIWSYVFNQALQIQSLFDAAARWVEIFTYLSAEVRFLLQNSSASRVLCQLPHPGKNFLPVYHLKCQMCHPALQIVKLVHVLPLPGKNFLPVYHLKCEIYFSAPQLRKMLCMCHPLGRNFCLLLFEVIDHASSSDYWTSVSVATPWEKFSARLPSEERSLPPSSSARRFLARISADRPGRVPHRGQRSGHTAPTLPGYPGLKYRIHSIGERLDW